jgi:hypothetical protein
MDLSIFETGNGGDIIKTSNNLETTEALFNQIYLAWFGGNLNDDFWLIESESNGNLETLLNNVALTPQGLKDIQVQAKNDLLFLEDEVNISIAVEGLDRLKIIAEINQKTFTFVWDATKSELIESRYI